MTTPRSFSPSRSSTSTFTVFLLNKIKKKFINCHEIILVPVATLRGTLDVNNMFSTEKYHMLHICVDGFQEISYILV